MASDTLLASMLMLASWVAGRHEHLELAPVVFDEVADATGPESVPSLHNLQALLLCVVYAVCRRGEESMLVKAVRLNAILVSICRCLDIFSGHHVLPERLEECALMFWLAKEQLHRLAFSVLRLDTYLSVLLDHPPSVRYEELCIPLPKSSQLWMATSEEDRRKLQWNEPAGREKALFSSIIRDALVDTGESPGVSKLPYRLSAVDYHLGLCALQSGVWAAAREAHSAATDELMTKLAPGSPIELWRSHLTAWRAKMAAECEELRSQITPPPPPPPPQNPATPDAVLTPLTLILWHISTIKMHAPLTLLRMHARLCPAHGGGGGGGAAGPGLGPDAAAALQKPRARMRSWLASACARMAVWSAAQIARLVVVPAAAAGGDQPAALPAPDVPGRDVVLPAAARRQLLNPLAVPGLLMGAIVTCAYAAQTSACPACCPVAAAAAAATAAGGGADGSGGGGGGGAAAAVDLFVAADEDAALVAWKEHGMGWAVWGPSGIVVCRCRLAALGGWFSAALGRERGAKGEFEAFFEGLVGG
ncbi:46fc4c23-44e7-4e08-8856-5fb8848ebb16 [Thermothielavioides terrestris]|uniref:46fc4c23-44e7-4e08-8856-5fb8848ebb16 n=1 Tax=Thermothielavioides terrestris TaxID=2587410 RepID=A0A3S4F750_9PEZI|nr:46fc4c23-44e7-4e08-8856-5fb8848ebb16 [Thermothielavioides terrestris]